MTLPLKMKEMNDSVVHVVTGVKIKFISLILNRKI